MKALTFLKIFMMRNEIPYKVLAQRIGVSDSILRGWVDGDRRIPVQRLEQFKKVLKIDHPELLSEKMRLPTSEEMGLLGDNVVKDIERVKSDIQIIWQPVGSELKNFQASVLDAGNEPPISSDSNFLRDLKHEIKKIGSAKVSVWGVKNGKSFNTLNKFRRIKKGDIVMFYSSQKFIAYGEVIGKLESEEWSKDLWESNEFKNIYILRDVRPIELDFLKFTKLVYGKPSKSLQSLRILDEEKSERVLNLLIF